MEGGWHHNTQCELSSYVFVQGSIFGVSFDFSYNENGLHIIHIHSHSYSDMASVSIGTLWRAVRRELWTELLVCHRQTHNKWLHRAGSFWKWHFRSVRGEILCVCGVQPERTFQSYATVRRPQLTLETTHLEILCFWGCVFVFTAPGQHSRREGIWLCTLH